RSWKAAGCVAAMMAIAVIALADVGRRSATSRPLATVPAVHSQRVAAPAAARTVATAPALAAAGVPGAVPADTWQTPPRAVFLLADQVPRAVLMDIEDAC